MSSNHYCSVPQCKSWAKKNPGLSFHLFPTAGKYKTLVVNKLGVQELVDVRKMWIKNLKIGKTVTKFMKVCSLHFTEYDYFIRGDASDVKRRKLKQIAVPSKKLPVGRCELSSGEPGPSARTKRQEKRIHTTESQHKISCKIHKHTEDHLQTTEPLLVMCDSANDQPLPEVQYRDSEGQVNIPNLHILAVRVLPSEESQIMENEGTYLATPSNSISNYEIKTEELEDVKFNLEDLHHAIDIKEDIDSTQLTLKPSNLFECAICGYKLAHKQTLIRHLRSHKVRKPFLCDICNHTCPSKSHLVIHLRTHTGEKPFSCQLCEYKCSNNGSLNVHLRTHTGEKPFNCDLCAYKCARNGSLKRHLRTHTGEKPFSCNFCVYKCSDKTTLNRHLRTHSW